jgi:hypothetical protein
MKRPTIFAALPTYDGRRRNAEAMCQLVGIKDAEVRYLESQSSLLAFGFNLLWVRALNERPDYFLMLHDDIAPLDHDWAVTLFREFQTTRASVLSAVVPIKTPEGLTSTALETEDPWHPKRLTMTEVFERPETWTEPGLLLNSGLMLVDFRQAWVEQVCFTIEDQIRRDDSGKWTAEVKSEDWNFSRQARALGASLYATRKIRAQHVGPAGYRNDRVWGTVATDPQFAQAEALR